MTSETADLAAFSRAWLRRLAAWAVRVGLARKLVYALMLAAAAMGIATYAVLTGSGLAAPEPTLVLVVLNIDVVLLLILAVVVARRIVAVWMARRRGSAGSRLHTRLVLMFGLVGAVPAILMAVFSVLFLHLGIESWFNKQVSTAVNESLAVAEAYLKEHQQNIRGDVMAMATDISREGPLIIANPKRFAQIMSTQAALRSLSEAVVFDGSGHVMAQAGFSFALEFEPLPDWALVAARNHEVAILTSESDDRVRALVKLDGFDEAYLYVGRLVDPKVVGHMQTTQRAVRTYQESQGRLTGYQVTFVMFFVMVALLLLLAAVLFGLMLATQLARPISRLVEAAEKVRSGDLSARVEEGPQNDEVGTLSRAFNRMTSQLNEQRSELVEANRQLDLRRRFTEAVLSGVSAGVIGLDQNGCINLPNRSASNLLGIAFDRMIGAEISEAVPEMAALFRKARRRSERMVESQITVLAGGRPRTLLVRIAAEKVEGEVQGFVVTFDDVTELLSAQRKAAWADVARRIAHEIKNPLTPIQLSAERLKRKYLREIKSDPETFTICTDTIVRQVADIGRMVDEFSSFARMPAPVMGEEDLADLCRRAVFLQRNAHAKIDFVCDVPDDPVRIRCDGRQIGQALTNLLQNAAEAVSGNEKGGRGKPHGRVHLRVLRDGERTVVEIEDDGPGFPPHLRERLTEPYVTTRAKGTGLGLAIVKKIMEDHGGDLILADREGGGALVRLVFRNSADAGAVDAPGEGEGAVQPAGPEAERILAHGS